MSSSGIAKASEFKAAVERANVECVVLPASGLTVRLCRPPVFAALAMAREGTHLQARVTGARPEEIKAEDVEAFTRWLTETLTRLFVEPRFAAAPETDEIGLGDLLIEDLKFLFRWLRGEVFSAGDGEQETVNSEDAAHSFRSTIHCTEDLGRFPGGQGTPAVPGGSRPAELLPSQPASGARRDARLPVGLQRG